MWFDITEKRKFYAISFLAWAIIYICLFFRSLNYELSRGSVNSPLIIFGILFTGLAAALFTSLFVCIPLKIAFNLLSKERSLRRKQTIFFSIVFFLGIGYTFEIKRERWQLAPPTGVTSFEEFVRRMPFPKRLQTLKNNNRLYIAWTGNYAGPIDLPSGPACYLFSPLGELINWQVETGDGGPVDDILRNSSGESEISVDQALELIKKSKSTTGGAKPIHKEGKLFSLK